MKFEFDVGVKFIGMKFEFVGVKFEFDVGMKFSR